jgi:CubicO group peptidase (beta-lactamase class C family)
MRTWKPITIHEVLTHTSGIRDLATQTVPASPAEALAPYNHAPLDFPPGTQYEYSNAGYILLGYIIQQVSGEPYASFIQQRILAPLHMTDTGFVHYKIRDDYHQKILTAKCKTIVKVS